jgi:hypothetical protein
MGGLWTWIMLELKLLGPKILSYSLLSEFVQRYFLSASRRPFPAHVQTAIADAINVAWPVASWGESVTAGSWRQ